MDDSGEGSPRLPIGNPHLLVRYGTALLQMTAIHLDQLGCVCLFPGPGHDYEVVLQNPHAMVAKQLKRCGHTFAERAWG